MTVPTSAPMVVTLQEITRASVGAVIDLAVAPVQRRYVATNAESLSQALFAPEAWFRMICVDDEPAGFVMLEDETLLDPAPAQPKIGVWRFMIDARFQGRGIGRAAMALVVEHVRARAQCSQLWLSYVPGPDGPEGFYLGLGFRPTGEMDGGEVVLSLPLH